MNSAEASVSTTKSCGIAVMAKASAPGRTKTRLVPPLTGREAAAFNTAFLQDISANILAAGKVRHIQPYMAYGPPGPEFVAFFRDTLPGEVGLLEAWWPDFGDCLYGAIDQLLTLGHASAVVLNSDSPTLPTSLLVETAEVLSHPGDRAVLGPSTDGGYYLLGLKARHRRLFEDSDVEHRSGCGADARARRRDRACRPSVAGMVRCRRRAIAECPVRRAVRGPAVLAPA